jgi:hypothetical protein
MASSRVRIGLAVAATVGFVALVPLAPPAMSAPLTTEPTPSITIGNRTRLEGTDVNTVFKFKVRLSAPSASSVSVTYSTANGTASAPSDYTARSQTLTFPAGVTQKLVKIVVIGDSAAEPDETFNVNLSNPLGATIADSQGRGTVENDD